MYTENLAMGYRWYEARAVPPVFPFGHGLSYTTFTYSGLSLTPTTSAAGTPALTVTYTLANTGAREGREATQIYLTLPPEAHEPSKRLVAFNKVSLQPTESQEFTVMIDCSASSHPFSYFAPADEENLEAWANGDWVTPSGQFVVSVGGSSMDPPLQSTVDLDLTGCVTS